MSKQVRQKTSKVRKVPYARGFRPPTKNEQIAAIGFQRGKALPIEYADRSKLEGETSFFHPVPVPTSIDDWLAQYCEEGQIFRAFLKENPWFSKRKHKFLRQEFSSDGKNIREKYPEGKIYIAQLGDFHSDMIEFRQLIDYVEKFLCLPVKELKGLTIEEKGDDLVFTVIPTVSSTAKSTRIKRSFLTKRSNEKTKRVQLCVDSILPKMHRVIPDDALCLIALTPYDLFGDETDLFVAGMAAGYQRVAVFSLLRYDPCLSFSTEHWFDIKEDKNFDSQERSRLILQRSCKLVVHELCHLLGVPHCIYFSCCMNGSGHLEEDFSQPMTLCPVDLRKLQTLIGFDIENRYKNLLEFYKQHGFKEEMDWVEKRLQFLKEKVVASAKE